MPVLREAMRFDPLSEYLGVRTSQAEEIAVVDRGGHSGSPQIGAALRAGICQPDGGAIELCPIIKLPGDDAWYLPLALGARRGDAVDVVFALVPVRSLVAAAQTLQLIPGSWLNFALAQAVDRTRSHFRRHDRRRDLRLAAAGGSAAAAALLRAAGVSCQPMRLLRTR